MFRMSASFILYKSNLKNCQFKLLTKMPEEVHQEVHQLYESSELPWEVLS